MELIESEVQALIDLARAKVDEINRESIADGSNAGSSTSQVFRGHRLVRMEFTIWQVDGRSKMHVIEAWKGIRGGQVKVEVYWKDLTSIWVPRAAEMGPNHLVVNHTWYRFNDPVYKNGELQRGRGFGGRTVQFHRIDGDGKVIAHVEETRDIWFGGRIPPEFHELIPDNAIFLHDFDGPVVMH